MPCVFTMESNLSEDMKPHLLLNVLSVALAIDARALNDAPVPNAAEVSTILHAVVDLSDGSRLVGTPQEKSLPVTLSYANPTVPFQLVTRCEIKHSPDMITLFLQNGDHITGTPDVDAFPLDTMLGKLSPKFSQIDRIEMSVKSTGALSEGSGDITYCGFKWEGWRTRFEQQGKRLMTMPQARGGFNYGHNGNGRSAQVSTNIGAKDWTDYRIDVDYCMTGVDPAFNLHGLPLGYRSGSIMFHVVAASESWNGAPGTSTYHLGLGPDGVWTLGCIYDSYSKTDVGHGNPYTADSRTLASGKGLNLDPTKGNHIRIEVVGTRITAWVDNQLLADVRDEKMGEEIAGKKLTYGGVAFAWGWECMGWIENFSATRL